MMFDCTQWFDVDVDGGVNSVAYILLPHSTVPTETILRCPLHEANSRWSEHVEIQVRAYVFEKLFQ